MKSANTNEKLVICGNLVPTLSGSNIKMQVVEQSLNLLEEHQKRIKRQLDQEDTGAIQQNQEQLTVNFEKIKVKGKSIQANKNKQEAFNQITQKLEGFREKALHSSKSNSQLLEKNILKKEAAKISRKVSQQNTNNLEKADRKEVQYQKYEIKIFKSKAEENFKQDQPKIAKSLQLPLQALENQNQQTSDQEVQGSPQIKKEDVSQTKIKQVLEVNQKQNSIQGIQQNGTLEEIAIETTKLTKANDISQRELIKYKKNQKIQNQFQLQTINIQLDSPRVLNSYQSEQFLVGLNGVKKVRFSPVIEIIE